MSAIPDRIDRMPPPEANLEVAHLIAFALNSVPYEWWRVHRNEPPLSETSQPVKAVLDGLRIAGYEIVRKGKVSHD
jgi:hypothetical protein